MPRFDGTGPQGAGPMTGRGEGYCVMELPEPGRTARGVAGLQGTPVARAAGRLPLSGWWGPLFWCARTWAARRGRGRRPRRW